MCWLIFYLAHSSLSEVNDSVLMSHTQLLPKQQHKAMRLGDYFWSSQCKENNLQKKKNYDCEHLLIFSYKKNIIYIIILTCSRATNLIIQNKFIPAKNTFIKFFFWTMQLPNQCLKWTKRREKISKANFIARKNLLTLWKL